MSATLQEISPNHYAEQSQTVTFQPIDLFQWYPFPIGNAMKYLIRHAHKNKAADMQKAVQYLLWWISDPELMKQCRKSYCPYKPVVQSFRVQNYWIQKILQHNGKVADPMDLIEVIEDVRRSLKECYGDDILPSLDKQLTEVRNYYHAVMYEAI